MVDYTADVHLDTFSNGKWIEMWTNGNVVDLNCVQSIRQSAKCYKWIYGIFVET